MQQRFDPFPALQFQILLPPGLLKTGQTILHQLHDIALVGRKDAVAEGDADENAQGQGQEDGARRNQIFPVIQDRYTALTEPRAAA